MYCPNCKQEHTGKFCPECGTKLIERPANQGGFNVSLGDANAISGGINLSDSHNVHNEDKSVHNISNVTNNTSNISNITNVTNVAAQKSENQIHQENLNIYREAFREAYDDEVLTPAERSILFDLRMRLHLSKDECEHVESEMRLMAEQSSRSEELSFFDKMELDDFIDAINRNDVNEVREKLGAIESIANNCLNADVQYAYYMTLSALEAKKCAEKYENKTVSNYWLSFWSYIAYINIGSEREARNILSSLSKFKEYPEDNIYLLVAVATYTKEHSDHAKKYLANYHGNISPILKDLEKSLLLLVDDKNSIEYDGHKDHCLFYMSNILCSTNMKEESRTWEDANDYSEGYAAVGIGNKYGFIDIKGNLVIPCIYDKANIFRENLAAVKRNGAWGYVNKKGEEVIPCKYEGAGIFSEGLAYVMYKKLWGYIDKDGNVVIPFKYEDANPFFYGIASVRDENGSHYIDKSGNILFSDKWGGRYNFHEGLAPVRCKRGWGFIDTSGEQVIYNKHYEEVFWFHEGVAAVKSHGAWGYINKEGRYYINCNYRDAKDFHEGLAAVQNDDLLYGYIDKSGKEVIPCQYKYAADFNEGYAIVNSDEAHIIIDKKGNHIFERKLGGRFGKVSCGKAFIQEDGGYKYINVPGKYVSSHVGNLDNANSSIANNSVNNVEETCNRTCNSVTNSNVDNTAATHDNARYTSINNGGSKVVENISKPLSANSFTFKNGILEILDYRAMANSHSMAWRNYATDITAIEIKEGIESISDWAFEGCTNLASVSLPNSLKHIGGHSFENCSKLNKIRIPGGVTSIGESAFSGCTSLELIFIPKGVEAIMPSTFFECKSLNMIRIPGNVKKIGQSAFYSCINLNNLIIAGNGLETIDSHAFGNCKNLKEVILPHSIQNVASDAFPDDCLYYAD